MGRKKILRVLKKRIIKATATGDRFHEFYVSMSNMCTHVKVDYFKKKASGTAVNFQLTVIY